MYLNLPAVSVTILHSEGKMGAADYKITTRSRRKSSARCSKDITVVIMSVPMIPELANAKTVDTGGCIPYLLRCADHQDGLELRLCLFLPSESEPSSPDAPSRLPHETRSSMYLTVDAIASPWMVVFMSPSTGQHISSPTCKKFT